MESEAFHSMKIEETIKRICKVFNFFLTATWLPHGPLWAILKGTTSLNPMLITAF